MADIAGATTADRDGEYAGRKTGKARSSRLGLETRSLVAALNEMAESFGSSFAVVQVTADDTTTQIWVALAKPGFDIGSRCLSRRLDRGSVGCRIDTCAAADVRAA